MAIQRLGPTLSPSRGTDKAHMKRGPTKAMVTVSAKGSSFSA